MSYQNDSLFHHDPFLISHNSLAKRSGEGRTYMTNTEAMTYTDWLDRADTDGIEKVGVRHIQTFAPLGEKQAPTANQAATKRQTSIKTLPFSYETFKSVCERFQIHESITKAITRNLTPSFSYDQIKMEETAYGTNTLE